jgi:RNA recognition motif-containing protein
MADAAIAALNGLKIKGRKIGVRDADAPRDEKPRRKQIAGARIYVGNLPFKASEDDLAALFKDHCDTAHVQWAIDKAGRKKAFAFVTIMPESKGEEVAGKLNGFELMGRKIKVDLAKPRENNSSAPKKTDGDSGGKTSRELRALAEEEEDAKKKRRRPKKD